jgi:hypothetical protein
MFLMGTSTMDVGLLADLPAGRDPRTDAAVILRPIQGFAVGDEISGAPELRSEAAVNSGRKLP